MDYTLRAIRQFHLKDQSSLLEEPLVRFFKNGTSTWNIVAELGLIGGSTAGPARLMETIQLSGDVEIHRLDAYGNSTVLSTQRLGIDPNQETLETQDTVQMVTASITHIGRGMFADLNRDEINFHSKSGNLRVTKNDENLCLNFPVDPPKVVAADLVFTERPLHFSV